MLVVIAFVNSNIEFQGLLRRRYIQLDVEVSLGEHKSAKKLFPVIQ